MTNDPGAGQVAAIVVLVLVLIFVVVALVRAVRIVPQAVAIIVERLGRYNKTFDAGLHLLIPFVDRVRASVDLREQVVSFPPQPVITSDNLVVSIDTVIYFQVTSPKDAVYEIANYITGIEQLTVTTLRNVIGSMDLEQTLTSRDQINGQLRGVLDEATGKWGIRVNRVELKAIDPPASVQGSMEQQMRAERDRRAAILTAEGVKQRQVLEAQGQAEAVQTLADAERYRAETIALGEGNATRTVYQAIHDGGPTNDLIAIKYLEALQGIADGRATKIYLPLDTGSVYGSLAGIAELFQGAGDDPTDEGPGSAARRREAAGRTASTPPPIPPVPPTPPPSPEIAQAAQQVARAAEMARAAELDDPLH